MNYFTALFATGVATLAPHAADARSCTDLATADIANVTVLAAQAVPAGPFQPPPLYGQAQQPMDLPAHCRVRAVASPAPGSRIGMEVWLPQSGVWNERFRMYGNGGYSSAMPLPQLAQGLRSGAIVAATDTGHQGDDPEFAVGLPESIADWGHRAVHQTAVAAKAFAAAFYGKPPRYSYFSGCSTGGHQALMEAQRYPGDFDGIVAGAPGNNRSRLNIGFLWQFVSNRHGNGDEPILPPSKLRLVTAEALRQCGTGEEQARGWLNNPFACRPDPAALLCTAGSAESCLTGDQVQVMRRMYRGATNPRTGAQIYPPWLPGSESIGADSSPLPGWSLYWSDPRDPARPARETFFRFWAFNDAGWRWRSFDFDRDVEQIDRTLGRLVDAVDPDLTAFRQAGGKLIQYHGLMDPVVSPWDSRNYYDAVAEGPTGSPDSFYRLFFAPGMGHCAGGPGVVLVNADTAIETWVEQGKAPDRLETVLGDGPSRNVGLCPYPHIGLCR